MSQAARARWAIVALHWVLRPSNCTLVCGVVDGIKRPDGGRGVNKEAGQQGSRRRRQETRDKILENE